MGTRPLRVAVVGAGVGGLTAAIALRARGFEVEVYDQVRELSEIGAGSRWAATGCGCSTRSVSGR